VELRNLSNKNNIDFANTDKIMRFQVVADSGPASTITSIPTTLDSGPAPDAAQGGIKVMDLTPAMAVAKRELRFERDGGQWTINGVTWEDVEATGFKKLFANPQPFTVEQWTFTNNSGGWFHPVHVHLIAGKIIARNTNGGKPFAWELGPKDVFYAGEGESVTALMQFATQPQFVMRVQWSPGDLVIWDNRCTMHRATEFDDIAYRRDMRRTTVKEAA
jgi:FtsP/CotA-like multicopper oxidase with cupredoxin domain